MKFFQKLDTGHKVQLSGVLSALFENARVNIAENIIMVYKILKDLYNREIKNMEASDIENKINELPEDLKKEVIDFIDFLIMKKKQRRNIGSLNFMWEGGLAGIKDKYSSVELQHQANDWR